MTDGPRVYVVDYGRKYLQMRYTDPATGKHVMRSTKSTNRRDAERAAAEWEAELRDRGGHGGRILWESFRERFEREHLSGLAATTEQKYSDVLNAVEAIAAPKYLAELTAQKISDLQASLREKKRAETTIAGHMTHLRSALNWAVDQGMLARCPKIPKVKRAKTGSKAMKGRPLTEAEFIKMLRAVPYVVGNKLSRRWRHYLRGLWLSGLRLEESINLWWDRPDRLHVDFTGRRPMFRIHSELEKGNKDRLLPMTPDFAAFLLKTPAAARTGLVFRLGQRYPDEPVGKRHVSRIVSEIGEMAGIVVDSRSGKFASAHDLRRSFGERWARKPGVTAPILMELMRHESIATTMKFYVGVNAEATADVLWETVESSTTGSTRL